MQVSWLHVSDFHIRGGDPYDRDVVLKTLAKSGPVFSRPGRAPDLIFATGDIAHGGKPAEYDLATKFFEALLDAAKLEMGLADKRRNHSSFPRFRFRITAFCFWANWRSFCATC
jgi:3',5'-cyclic AMP phosphodiesterase CpdA